MPKQVKFIGTVDNGILSLSEPFKLRTYLATLGHVEVTVTIKKKVRSRSSQQNRYYWGVVIRLLSELTGFTDDEMHDAMRFKFLRIMGDLVTVKGTSTLDTEEMEAYIEKIRQWASTDLSLFIPDPNSSMLPEFGGGE